jgi:peptide/nickel transport system permease protein
MNAPSSVGGFMARRALSGAATVVAVPALSFVFWTMQVEDGPWSLGGDRPSVWGRLATYLQDTFIHFELGRSTELGAAPVSQTIRDGLPVDLTLLLGGLILGTLGGVAGGLACVRRRRGALARALRGAATLALCVPVYSAALLTLLLVSSNVGLLPLPFVSGSGQYVALREDPLGWLRAMWVPWLLLAAPIAAPCLRVTETVMRESARDPFIQTARAKGLTERAVLRHHLLPVAATPAVSLAAASIGLLVLNIALVEVAFNLHGSFRNIRTAVTRLDLPLVQGMVLVATILVVIGSTLADLVLLLLERRERS